MSDIGRNDNEDTEYYLSLDEILFFETEAKEVWVHTTDKMYQTRYKLYELEEQPDLLHYKKSYGIKCGGIYGKALASGR